MFSEFAARQADSLRLCEYGVPFLDDALVAIRPCDLIVIAAKTGMGKTQLGSSIALNSAQKGKQVYFFALEAEEYEIERRLKYQLLAKEFFNRKDQFPKTHLTYPNWLCCKYDELYDLEIEIGKKMPEYLHNLEIYQPGITEFSKMDFATVYESIAKNCDLVILDHIHYLSPENKENEYEHIKRTMWRLRDLINKHRVPVIALSHLRKKDRFAKSVVPMLEELHGSSEISKQANAVISFSEAYAVPSRDDPSKSVQPKPGATFCKIIKARAPQPRAHNYISLLKFDLDQQCYENSYVPYQSNEYADKLNPMKYQDFEFWMGLAREPKS